MRDTDDRRVLKDDEFLESYVGGFNALECAEKVKGNEKEKELNNAKRSYKKALRILNEKYPETNVNFRQNIYRGIRNAYWKIGMVHQGKGEKDEANYFFTKSLEYNVYFA